jgi:hypothetical protein
MPQHAESYMNRKLSGIEQKLSLHNTDAFVSMIGKKTREKFNLVPAIYPVKAVLLIILQKCHIVIA